MKGKQRHRRTAGTSATHGIAARAPATPPRQRPASGEVQFIHVGDLHVGTWPVAAPITALAADLRRRSGTADFVITGGDNTEAGLDAQYEAFARAFAGLHCPLYVIRGNHDFGHFASAMRPYLPARRQALHTPRSDDLAAYHWNGVCWDECMATATRTVFNLPKPQPPHFTFYPSAQEQIVVLQDRYQCAYAFRHRGWEFIVLDSSLWVLSAGQMAWLREQLAAGTEPVIVFIHHSLLPCGNQFDGAPLWNRWALLELAASAPRVKALFSAHLHMSRVWTFGGLKVVTTGCRALRRVTLAGGEIASISGLDAYEADGAGQDFVNRYSFISGRQGCMYRLNDGRLWAFAQKSATPDAGFAWAEQRADTDTGLDWTFLVPPRDAGSRYEVKVNFACRGRWVLQVRDQAALLAEKRGRGDGSYRIAGLKVLIPRPGLHSIRFFQPAGQPAIEARVSYFAFASRADYDAAALCLREPESHGATGNR